MSTARIGMALAGIIALCSTAQAQQRSLFGNRGPLAGPDGFSTGTLGISPSVQVRTGGAGVRYQTSNSLAPTGMFDRRGGLTFGPSGVAGTYTRSLQGNPVAGPSFNRGIPPDEGWPGEGMGYSTEQWGPPPGVVPLDQLPPDAFLPRMNSIDALPVEAPTEVGMETSASSPRPAVRPELRRVGVVGERPRRTMAQRAVLRQVRQLSKQPRFQNVVIGLEGGVWTLRGEVDSYEARDLAEAFATLEPGVGHVRNEIMVRGAE
jgi:hypothetical protein